MGKKPTAGAGRPVSVWRRLGLGAAVVGALVGIVLGWTGIGDWRPFCGLTNTCVSSSSGNARNLSPDSPVTVVWTGEGDAVKATWDAVEEPELDYYVLEIIGLYPESFSVDAGYRPGEELLTSRVVNPASDAMHRFRTSGDSLTLTADQTWQLCVTAYRETPAGGYIEEYEIQGSERCSDPFVLPKG